MEGYEDPYHKRYYFCNEISITWLFHFLIVSFADHF